MLFANKDKITIEIINTAWSQYIYNDAVIKSTNSNYPPALCLHEIRDVRKILLGLNIHPWSF